MKLTLQKAIGKIIFLFSLFISVLGASAQVALPHYDGLNYADGTALQTQTGWASINTGDNLLMASGSLNYAGLPASTGNRVTFDGSGMEGTKSFTQQATAGTTVYFSFLMNVTALGSLNGTGGYFAGFVDNGTSNFGATVWTRLDGAGYDIGINPRTTAANTLWSSGTTALNTTVMVVISYQLVSGAANDVVKLWINPGLGLGTEPTAMHTITNTGTDLANLNKILLRQDGASATPFITMDEFRIGTTWASVTPAGLSITATGTLGSLSTTYGTASSATQFVASGSNLNEGITITPPVGFEVAISSDFSTTIGTNAAPLVIGAAGNIDNTDIYVRLAANAAAGNHNGNIVLTSSGATSVNVPTNATNTVNAKELTISGLTANDKVFDNTTTATLSGTATLEGVVSGDEANVVLGGTPVANFADAAVGTNKPVTVTGYTISGSAAGNYTLSQPTGLTASITSSGLLDQTITFNPLAPVTYGVAPFNLTATSDSNLTVTYTSSDTNIATISGSLVTIVGAGTVTITAQQAGNGSYNPAADVEQELIVNPKSLTVDGASAEDKTYDATTAAVITGGTLTGVINADDVSFSGGGNFDDANVGAGKPVTGALVLSGADAANYALTQPVLSAAIDAKELTITGITIANKEYDTNTTATITGTPALAGVISGDAANVTLGGTPTATFNDAAVGDNKPVTVSGYTISGSASGNYTLTQPTGLTANITLITLEIIGLTADDKVYDRTSPTTVTGTASLSGILPGDESNVSLTGTAVANFDTVTAGTDKPVSVTGFGLTGSAVGNYILSPLSLTADVMPKDLTIDNAVANDKPYDGTTAATLSGTLNGVIAPDAVTLNLSGQFADAAVGTGKPVTSTSTITGADAFNYNLVQPVGLTASITLGTCGVSSTGNISWNFVSAAPSSNAVAEVTVSNVSQGNNNGTTTLITNTSPSNYVGASAAQNAGAAAFTGVLNTATSTYFEFTLTPAEGFGFALTGMSFGSRSTGTGPQAYTLRSNLDNYTANIAAGTLTNNSTWVLHNPVVASTSNSGTPVTFRLYGSNGSGTPTANTANWRIDDLNLTVSVTPDSALSSAPTATVCSGDTFSYTATTGYPGATITWTRAAVAGISNAAITAPQTSNPNEVLVNTTNGPVDVVYAFTVTTATCSLTQDVTVTVDNCSTSSIVNLKLFIEGYYMGAGAMQPVADNQAGIFPPVSQDVELITVELHEAVSPYAVVASTTAMLQTDGTAACEFPTSPNGSYYIAVKTRNVIQTWSADPQTVGTTPLTYDFTTAASQAYGDNMVSLGDGAFAFYSGDITDGFSQDGLVDATDYSIWETDNNNFAFGDYATDLNGDGLVDSSDYSIWEANNNNFIFANYPFD